MRACKAAKDAGLVVSCDLNYRKKLWSGEKAFKVMENLCPYVDVCIANEEDAADVFGIRGENTDAAAGEVNYEGYKDVARRLMERFRFSKVAITLRESSQPMIISGRQCSMTVRRFVSVRNIKYISLTVWAAGTVLRAGLIYAPDECIPIQGRHRIRSSGIPFKTHCGG